MPFSKWYHSWKQPDNIATASKTAEIPTGPAANDDEPIYRRTFSKARVNCCLRASEVKWGTKGKQKAVILFIELGLYEPVGYRFSEVKFDIEFSDTDNDRIADQPDRDTEVKLLARPAPQGIYGGPEKGTVGSNWNIGPEVQVMGQAVKVGDVGGAKTLEQTRFWIFRSSRDNPNGRSFNVANWIWEANAWKPQVDETGPLYAAVAVGHAADGSPFYVRCKADAQLFGPLAADLRPACKPRWQQINPRPPTDDLNLLIARLDNDVVKLYDGRAISVRDPQITAQRPEEAATAPESGC